MSSNVVREYTELRQVIKGFRAGKIKMEDYDAILRGYKETHKRMELILKAAALSAQYTASMQVQRELKNVGLLGNGEYANPALGEIDNESVLCEQQGRSITRAECLDRSGSTEHFEDCEGCETGKICKQLLLDETPMFQA